MNLISRVEYFCNVNFSSKLIEQAVEEFSQLPGIGKKTAFRFVLHLLKQDKQKLANFSDTILRLKDEIKYCKVCCNVTEHELCEVCSNPSRDKSTICVVEDIRDVIAIENTGYFKGMYHVLGGIISPMDGIGPNDLYISQLVDRMADGEVNEVIMALSTTMEGDTTNFYIYKKIKDFPVKVSTIARGIAIGGELEYADDVTLGRSIVNRVPYENSLIK